MASARLRVRSFRALVESPLLSHEWQRSLHSHTVSDKAKDAIKRIVKADAGR